MNRMHGIIFAYEQRGELRELTERRTAASMPFGGRYRAVDFALSNLLNAGVTDVGMVLHGRYQSMLDHVGSGKVWDMSRKRGGLHLLPPFNYLHEWGVTPFRGKMEALAGVRDYLNEIRQDYVVLMEGDLVANLRWRIFWSSISAPMPTSPPSAEMTVSPRKTAPILKRTRTDASGRCCSICTSPEATGAWTCL